MKALITLSAVSAGPSRSEAPSQTEARRLPTARRSERSEAPWPRPWDFGSRSGSSQRNHFLDSTAKRGWHAASCRVRRRERSWVESQEPDEPSY